MYNVWRIVTARFAEEAFSGEGARRYGGRWNRKGIPMVYTAGSQSLALLEMLVQDQPLRANYVTIPAIIPADLNMEIIRPEQLPPIGATPLPWRHCATWAPGGRFAWPPP